MPCSNMQARAPTCSKGAMRALEASDEHLKGPTGRTRRALHRHPGVPGVRTDQPHPKRLKTPESATNITRMSVKSGKQKWSYTV